MRWRTLRQPDLRLHKVNPGHLFRHRVLDLEARVRLDEHEWLRVRAAGDVDEELERPEIAVAHSLREADSRINDPAAEIIGQAWRGRHLDDLLEATLDTALALTEVSDGAPEVTEDLDLDVARALDELFGVDVRPAERAFAADWHLR